MSGFQEILVVVVILLGILFVPRMMPRNNDRPPVRPKKAISRNMRIFIAASVVYPLVAAAIIQPWHNDMIFFLYAGGGPVVLGWLFFWILSGRKK